MRGYSPLSGPCPFAGSWLVAGEATNWESDHEYDPREPAHTPQFAVIVALLAAKDPVEARTIGTTGKSYRWRDGYLGGTAGDGFLALGRG